MNFSFGVLTYNSSEFIIELLESIKYQIITFGNDFDCDLVISDDASTDNTVHLIKCWINQSKNIFRNIKLLENSCNKGIANNYCLLLENIETKYFIKVDGDDLLSSENIFKKCYGFNCNEFRVFFPVRFFEEAYYEDRDLVNILYYSGIKHNHNLDFNLIRSTKPFMTPQVVIALPNFTKENLSFVKSFSVFEDDTSIYSVFNSNEKMEMHFFLAPLVLYRVHNKSVSNGIGSYHQIMFLDDLHKFKKMLFFKEKNILIKVYLFFACIDTFLMKHRFSTKYSFFEKINRIIEKRLKSKVLSRKDYLGQLSVLKSYIEQENRHISDIRKKADDFMKTNIIDK